MIEVSVVPIALPVFVCLLVLSTCAYKVSEAGGVVDSRLSPAIASAEFTVFLR